MSKLKTYYWLVKPGIVYSNVLAAMAGFFLASSNKGELNLVILIALVVGIALVIASACVLNNYIDRNIDRQMKRTKKRAIVSGAVTPWAAIVYTITLGFVGASILVLHTNWLTVILGSIAYFSYIVLYGIAKRRSIHGTLVGTIPGALPPVAGYVAVTGSIDMASILLFLIFVCWQMPHFYAIAMRRRDEYKAASVPVMPVVKGMNSTKIQVLCYVAAFIILNSLLVAYGYVGYLYLAVMGPLGVVWFIKGIRGLKTDDDTTWARKMFLFSLAVLIAMCIMLSIGGLLL